MKVSPLEAKNKYGVLEIEETQESSPRPIDPLIVTYYTISGGWAHGGSRIALDHWWWMGPWDV